MMNENPSDAAQRAVEAIDEAYAKATPGEWGAFNCDDSHFMNMWGLTVYGPNAYGEPNDEDDLGNVLMVSCVQVPARFVCENDDANLDFIALAHNNWPAARAHIRTLEEQVARLIQQAELWKDIVRDEVAKTLRMVDALGIDRDSLGERPLAAVMLERVAALRAAAALASGGQAGN